MTMKTEGGARLRDVSWGNHLTTGSLTVLLALSCAKLGDFEDYSANRANGQQLGESSSTAGSAGISGSTGSSNRHPACEGVNWGEVDKIPNGLVARWRFDNGEPAGAPTPIWLDAVENRQLVPGTDGTTDVVPATTSSLRPSGVGNSVEFAGHQYAVYQGSSDDQIFSDSFTVGAFVTIDRRELTQLEARQAQNIVETVPVLSTFGGGCGGYQLGFRKSGVGLELVFTYESSSPSGCQESEVSRKIDGSWWEQSMGGWHHVAVSFSYLDDVGADVSLFFDGVRAPGDVRRDNLASSSITYQEYALYLGANGSGIADGSIAKLIGAVDDVSVFHRPLSDIQMLGFVQGTLLTAGPSRCRWLVGSAFRDSETRTKATLDAASNEAIKFTVDLQLNGLGQASARLAKFGASVDVRGYNWAYVNAQVPDNAILVFSLGSDDGYCSWKTQNTRNKSEFEFDLAKPGFCSVSTCAFDLAHVAWASVQSDWTDQPTKVPSKPVQFQINSIDFGVDSSETAQSVNWLNYGGAFGPGGWCWRPIAYEVGGLGQWARSPSSKEVAVTMDGNSNTTTRITADFGNQSLDLSKCETIELDAELDPKIEPSTQKFQLVVVETNDTWGVWNLQTQDHRSVSIHAEPASKSDNFDRSLSSIRQIGIQKPYNYSLQGLLNVVVKDMQFKSEALGTDCARVSTR